MGDQWCKKTWNDGKDHECELLLGHIGVCVCSCGDQSLNRAQRRAMKKRSR